MKARHLLMFLLTLSVSACSLLTAQRLMNNQEQPTPPVEMTWDLSKSHESQDVGWTTEGVRDYHTKEGNFDLTMKLSEGRIFHERAKRIHLKREGKTIEYILVVTGNKTLDEAYTDAQRLIKYWGFDYKNLDEWYMLNKEGKQNDPQLDPLRTKAGLFYSYHNFIYPSLSLEIRQSDSDEKPWAIHFQVAWIKIE